MEVSSNLEEKPNFIAAYRCPNAPNFSGVVKTCIQLVHDKMTRQHKSSIFVKYARGSLESIQILGLSWCKCMSFKTGKLGGWVSENYLAHARLITFRRFPFIYYYLTTPTLFSNFEIIYYYFLY